MSAEPRAIDRLRRRYTAAALMFLNIVLFFVLLNVAIASARTLWRHLHHSELGEEVRLYGLDRLAKAYPGWRREDLVSFFTESSRLNRWEYEPYTVFRPVPARGRFINVSANGYRENGGRAPWPPSPLAYNVFWFGGSTAFGVGLPDDQNIAAELTNALGPERCGKRVAVYNFGRPAYFSVQEGVLFQRLIRQHTKPDLAIFLDGLNEFGYSEPAMTPALGRMVEEATSGGIVDRTVDLAGVLPVASLPILRRRAQQPGESIELSTGISAQQTVDRWLVNRQMLEAIGREAGTRLLFVWQPIPSYHYDLRFHLFADPTAFAGWGTSAGYSIMDGLRADGALGDDFLWLADLQSGKRENLYVDRFHYTAGFSREIASAIAGFVRRGGDCGTDSRIEPPHS
jgi:hypothetical protein